MERMQNAGTFELMGFGLWLEPHLQLFWSGYFEDSISLFA
jgi:hypothetical protein